MAQLLIRFSSAPYGTSNATDGLDFAIGATNYGHDVTLLFEDDGVLMLLEDQAPAAGIKSLSKRLGVLAFFDIERCLYSVSALKKHGLNVKDVSDVAVAATPSDILQLYAVADHVVSF